MPVVTVVITNSITYPTYISHIISRAMVLWTWMDVEFCFNGYELIKREIFMGFDVVKGDM